MLLRLCILLSNPLNQKHKQYLILCHKSFLFYKYFFSLADLGLDQFIVKRYDGKVSTLAYYMYFV